MQISGKILLNSAENILKDREQGERRPYTVAKEEKREGGSSSEVTTTGVLEARLLKLQSDLKGLQSNYSREQVRYDYLQNRPSEINEYLTYEKQPLFPEYGQGMERETLKNEVAENMKRLIESLKSIQVELENLYALNFESPQGTAANLSSLVNGNSIKELDPERVAQLTRPYLSS